VEWDDQGEKSGLELRGDGSTARCALVRWESCEMGRSRWEEEEGEERDFRAFKYYLDNFLISRCN
jgi:hypothetical protein